MKRLLPAMVLSLAGCAQLPQNQPPEPALKTPEASATMAQLSASFSRAGQTSPSEHWWQGFGLPDLDRLIDTALKDQPDMAAARARLDRANQAARLAKLDTQVHYSTDASIVRERLSENGLFPPPLGGSRFTETTVNENLSYTLDWWGKNRALVRAAGNEAQAARDEAKAIRLAIAAAVADSYFAWADVDARLDLARRLEKQHGATYDLLKARFDAGLDSALPVLNARRRLDLDADQVQALEYLDHAWRYRLAALVGTDPDHAGALPEPSLDATLPALPDALPLGWLARRPDIAALRSRAEAASEQTKAAKADFYPNLDLRAMIGLDTLDLNKLLRAGSLTMSVGPALHLPIFNTNTLRAKLGIREADYAATVASYNHAILEAARQSADAYALVASLDQRNVAQRQAIKATEQTRALAEQRDRLGLTSPLDVYEAAATVLEQHLDATQLQAARLRARVALFQALGGDTNTKD